MNFLLPASRHDWTLKEVLVLLGTPFNDLLFQAHGAHRACHDPNRMQISTLVSVKTGSCPEDCAYCPQSAHYHTEVNREKLMPLARLLEMAKAAKAAGAERFCMGAAWRSPSEADLERVAAMVEMVKGLGLETCATLGMLTVSQAQRLAESGLDYYNHNLDTSPEFYGSIISTRTYADRLTTLQNVRDAGVHVCCGGILGMGESRDDRAGLLMQLANLPEHPESVPINCLVRITGTPLEHVPDLDPIELVRVIAAARIMMPTAYVRLSAGREEMTDELQALCFFAGANSVFYGEKLLTAANAPVWKDQQLFSRLGINNSITATISPASHERETLAE